MARRGGRVETFQDSMALCRIFINKETGHKIPYLVNFVQAGDAIANM